MTEDLKAQVLEVVQEILKKDNEYDYLNTPDELALRKVRSILQDPNVFVGRWEKGMKKAPENEDIVVQDKNDGFYVCRFGSDSLNRRMWKRWAYLPPPPKEKA
jgi:hypothetical protein